MHLRHPAIYLIGIVVLFSSCGQNDNNSHQSEQTDQVNAPTFVYVDAAASNIRFSNLLEEGLNTNILMYEYFYNGGGVVAGDFNGDDKIDLYFTSNMGENKLYLNKGNLEFEEIGRQAKVMGRTGPWKTGATLLDVNGDKRLDIYLCYSGAMPEEKRKNELFINEGNDDQGKPKFREAADEYGLGLTGFTNQAYFFDYDRDGDLDALILNHNPKNLPLLNEAGTKELFAQDDPLRGLRLMKQESGKFIDITTSSGINGSPLSYGLGLGIGDFNNDGWPDFYVSNDYAVPDYLYFNNKKGGFENKLAEFIGHNSQFSMGNDVADINNDGLMDIMTLDMLPEDNKRQKLLMAPDNYNKYNQNVRSGFHHQIMRNMLQLNEGIGNFCEIGQYAGISNTDWSWAALLADYNNDGYKDLYVTNGYLRDYTNLDFINYMDAYVKEKGRLMREDVLNIIEKMPASNVSNYIFENNHNLTFTDATMKWGIKKASNSNGAAYADLDNDGDLDLVVNNINQEAFILKNLSNENTQNHFLGVKLEGIGKNTLGLGAMVSIVCKGKKQILTQMPTRGYLSAVTPILHFGLGSENAIDTLIVKWQSGKTQMLTNVLADQVINLNEAVAKNSVFQEESSTVLFKEVNKAIPFVHAQIEINDFDRQPLMPVSPSYFGPCIVRGDVNNDGILDLFIGGGAGQSGVVFIKKSNGSWEQMSQPDLEQDLMYNDANAAFGDFNNDGNLDIYIASSGYGNTKEGSELLKDRIYLNDGSGHFLRNKKSDSVLNNEDNQSLVILDVNGDGYKDILTFSSCIPGRYPLTGKSQLLINNGKGEFLDEFEKYFPDWLENNMVKDVAVLDLNQDGKNEIVVAGEFMPITIFGVESGIFKNKTANYLKHTIAAWCNKMVVDDFNGDGRPDLVLGNFGTNSQIKASDSQMAELMYKDFDGNGSIDPILITYIQGKKYPYVTRDELLSQLPKLKGKFNNYEKYAGATIDDIFKPNEIKDAQIKYINQLKSIVLLSQANGDFLVEKELPAEVQFSPVYAMVSEDIDGDGNKDLIIGGNNNHFKLRLGKMDANAGLVCLGDGKGGFTTLSQRSSGLNLKGDVRNLSMDQNELLAGINGQQMVVFKRLSK